MGNKEGFGDAGMSPASIVATPGGSRTRLPSLRRGEACGEPSRRLGLANRFLRPALAPLPGLSQVPAGYGWGQREEGSGSFRSAMSHRNAIPWEKI